MEDIDGGLHPAVDGQSLDEMSKIIYHVFGIRLALVDSNLSYTYKTHTVHSDLKYRLEWEYVLSRNEKPVFNWHRPSPVSSSSKQVT